MSTKKFTPYEKLSPTQKGNVIRGVRRDMAIGSFNDEEKNEPPQDKRGDMDDVSPLTLAINKKIRKVQ